LDDPGSNDPGRPAKDASFEARLAAARAKQGLDRPEGADRPVVSPWGLGLRAGLEVASALVVGVGLGLAIDWWAGTRPLFLVVGLFLGGAAGVTNVYRLMLGRRGTKGPGVATAPPEGGGSGAPPG
jgi:ATP synthase protein I